MNEITEHTVQIIPRLFSNKIKEKATFFVVVGHLGRVLYTDKIVIRLIVYVLGSLDLYTLL